MECVARVIFRVGIGVNMIVEVRQCVRGRVGLRWSFAGIRCMVLFCVLVLWLAKRTYVAIVHCAVYSSIVSSYRQKIMKLI